ncbi:LytR C-terminal domain-containing protein [Streptomyces sp. NPDC004096]|uniref:LytR C-terminal domain-containing protein n=1 Tax=unclassified Streptomyces TaxID=2593676 RepID=UPI0033AE2D37
MNDRYDGYAGGDQYELVGYDEFGQPVYRQVPAQQTPQGYDPYGTQQHQQPQQPQGYGYDPYATGTQQSHDTGRQPPVPPYDPYAPYGNAPAGGYDPYGRTATSGQQPRVAEQTAYIPQQTGPAGNGPGRPAGTPDRGPVDAHGRTEAPAQREPRGDDDYATGQFAFVEEPDGDSEDVIDWLQFTENRTERREEARRRARGRVVALVVVVALVAVGGVGYLWYAGKLPGTSSGGGKSGTATAVGAQNRDVIAVHLHNTKGGGTSTALLVDNTTTKQGATVLLPNSLALTSDDGTTTTVAKSVADDGSSGTGDAIDSVLGTKVEGTWRLDTPYLNNLVELVGNIEVTTNADVPDPDAKKKGAPLVHKGEDQTLSGKMAVAYATYRASGESQDAQLERFGQVMVGVLRKMSSDPQAATVTVQTLAQILDPSLTDKDLGSFLAKLADHAKQGAYKTELLPVQSDGTISEKATDTVVKSLLGGTVKSPEAGDAVRVGIKNATGAKTTAEQARVTLVNGGYTFIDAGSGTAQSTSQVLYADDGDKENAVEVAKTLGLPTSSVQKGKIANSADVSVVLGQDYKPSS